MVKIITENNYKKIIKNPEKFNIDMSFSNEIKAYLLSKEIISEMIIGAYSNFQKLKVDDNYFINMKSVFKTICELEKVTLVDKQKPASIENIKPSILKIII